MNDCLLFWSGEERDERMIFCDKQMVGTLSYEALVSGIFCNSFRLRGFIVACSLRAFYDTYMVYPAMFC